MLKSPWLSERRVITVARKKVVLVIVEGPSDGCICVRVRTFSVVTKTVAEMPKKQKDSQDETKSILGNEYQDYGLVMATGFRSFLRYCSD